MLRGRGVTGGSGVARRSKVERCDWTDWDEGVVLSGQMGYLELV